jgi:hypothetical protein
VRHIKKTNKTQFKIKNISENCENRSGKSFFLINTWKKKFPSTFFLRKIFDFPSIQFNVNEGVVTSFEMQIYFNY